MIYKYTHIDKHIHIYILDARRGALKRPPSRATFRLCDVPLLRRSVAPTLRHSDVVPSRTQPRAEIRRKSPELKTKTPDLKTKTPELKPKSPGAKDEDPGARDEDPRAKDEDPKVKTKRPKLKTMPPELKTKTP